MLSYYNSNICFCNNVFIYSNIYLHMLSQPRNGTILESNDESDKKIGWLQSTKDKIQEIQNYYSCLRKKKSHDSHTSGPACLGQYIIKRVNHRFNNENIKCTNVDMMKSVGVHDDDDIHDVYQMQYLARKIGAWRALEICCRIPISVQESKIDGHSEVSISKQNPDLNSVTAGLVENSSAFSIFGFSGLHEESLATLSMLTTVSSLFEIYNSDQQLNGYFHNAERTDTSITSDLISSDSFHLPQPSTLTIHESLGSAATAKEMILSQTVTITHNKLLSVESNQIDSTKLDTNGNSAVPSNDCTFTDIGNLLSDALEKNWRKRLKDIHRSVKCPTTDNSNYTTSSVQMVRDALITVIAINAGSMSEFDAFNNGWRTGVSGGGISIEVRLQSRIEMVKGLIRTLNLSWFLHVQDQEEESSPSFKIFEGR